MRYKYDLEADVLSVVLKNRPFSYAQEAGDFIVHYDEKDTPVYVEILNAQAFLDQATQVLPKRMIPQRVYA